MKLKVHRRCALWLAFLILLVSWWPGCASTPDVVVPTTPVPSATPAAKAKTPPVTSTSRPTPTVTQTPTPSPMVLATPSRTSTPQPVPTGSPTPTRPSTQEPAGPSATATASGPIIHYFRAGVEIADPGDTVTLSWDTSGADHVILYKLFYSGQLPGEGVDLPPSGTYGYAISPDEYNWVSFLLYVWDETDRSANAGVTVRLRCRYDWFFTSVPEDLCPTAPIVSWAAEQSFEHGTMIWVETESAIYVLYDDVGASPKWDRFEDTWTDDEPESDPNLQPPEGRQQPIRGFGKIWRENAYVRENLGWAIEPEHGLNTIIQRTTRYKYNAWYLLGRDHRVWYLGPERSSWDRLGPVTVILDPNGNSR